MKKTEMFPANLKSLNDQERHNYILKTYVLNKTQSVESRKHKRDIDVIREHHKFLWEPNESPDTWEQQLARRYYDKLFKEYCIADLSRYKENKVALRWRIESEVISGKGQFQCGSRKCDESENLKSWEVNFAYKEDGQQKNALVKLRLCPEHSNQLNYKSLKRAKKHKKKMEKRQRRNSLKKKVDELSLSSNSDTETDNDLNVTTEKETDKTTAPTNACEIPEPEENIWSKKIEIEPKQSRESEFERYLEDLLL